MVIELLILIFILWIFAGGFYSPQKGEQYKLSKIRSSLEKITSSLGYYHTHTYNIVADSQRSHVVDKYEIHLLLTNPKTGQFFDEMTLLDVALHEMAHVICPEEGHGQQFETIYFSLRQKACKLGYLEWDFAPDEDYPCMDDDEED